MSAQTQECTSFRYINGKGWSVPSFPKLDSPSTLVIAFGWRTLEDNPKAMRELCAAYPNAHIMACSTAGEISGTQLYDESIAVAIIRFEHTRLSSATVRVADSGNSIGAGESLGEKLKGDGLRAVFVVSDGMCVNGSELIRGLVSVLPEDVVITGGLAGDGSAFEQTWVCHEGEPESGIVKAIGFYGDRVRIGHGSCGGWDVFGPERVVTRSEGNVLYELDGKPALPLYKKYLGNRASELPGSALLFPLSVRKDRDETSCLVRTILAVDEEAGSMTFAGDVPQGHLAQLMRANFDRLIDGAEESARLTRMIDESAQACLCIAISCVGRRLVLGARTEEELERIAEIMPEGSEIVGFYSYGEISPVGSDVCDLHNQTMTLTTIREE